MPGAGGCPLWRQMASIRPGLLPVGISPAPVSRRIERLERAGVISGCSAIIDEQLAGRLEAFTEIRLAGSTETGELAEIVKKLPEVEAFYTIAGDPDALGKDPRRQRRPSPAHREPDAAHGQGRWY